VPVNLDIYGTMNTADRSIALLDIALRRRFEFHEMEPDYGVIDRAVEGVHLGRLLKQINDRLEYLLDRDHRIGHAYLTSVQSFDDLRRAFRTRVVPLLQEYFFDDLARVVLVLATVAPNPFIQRERLRHGDLFPGIRMEGSPTERTRYRITDEATWTGGSFMGMYEARGAGSTGELGELDGDSVATSP
jgi:5-methylcytosine-specific restriction protein B